jgi:hypothetical protein
MKFCYLQCTDCVFYSPFLRAILWQQFSAVAMDAKKKKMSEKTLQQFMCHVQGGAG